MDTDPASQLSHFNYQQKSWAFRPIRSLGGLTSLGDPNHNLGGE